MVEDNRDLVSKIAAFVLTLIAIPLLFVATCVPVGLVAIGSGLPKIIFGVYGAALVAFGIFKAIRTDNPGVRWAIIVALIAGVAAALYYLYPNFDVAWWR